MKKIEEKKYTVRKKESKMQFQITNKFAIYASRMSAFDSPLTSRIYLFFRNSKTNISFALRYIRFSHHSYMMKHTGMKKLDIYIPSLCIFHTVWLFMRCSRISSISQDLYHDIL